MVVYRYRNKNYEIVVEDEGEFNQQRKEIILRDFIACEKSGDYITIKNRMTKGIKWGWLKLIN